MIPPGASIAIRDRYLAPSLFAPFAEDTARRLSRFSMGPLLETSADTGVLTQAISSAMSAGLTIIATDPSAELVSFGSAKPGMARVTWQQADPAALPFADARFGIVACHFGIAMTTRRVQNFIEARRVMKQGGRFVFNVPAHLRHNPVAQSMQAAMESLFPADPPGFIGHVLHGYADTQLIDDDLTEAGFTDAIYAVADFPFVAASARDVAIGYCLGTQLRDEIEARAPCGVQRVVEGVTAALESRFGTGLIETTMRSHFVSAAG